MSKATLGMIEQLGHEIEAAAGADIARQVMAGAETLKASTKAPELARWTKGAMDRFDALADAKSRYEAMTACGRNCSMVNNTAVERGKARRAKFETEDEFLQAELQKPQTGTRMEKDGNFLYQIYTPASFRSGMRCFCSLMFGLPADQQGSRTYCLCSRAFAERYWQEVLGRPVTVDVLETAITGGTECRFKITL